MREEERKLLAEIAECFFRDVYYPVTLCIYLRLDGSVSGVFQFDTLYCPAIRRHGIDADRIFLLSNHHDGRRSPLEQDEINLSCIRADHPQASCFLAIYSSYDGLMESAL